MEQTCPATEAHVRVQRPGLWDVMESKTSFGAVVGVFVGAILFTAWVVFGSSSFGPIMAGSGYMICCMWPIIGGVVGLLIGAAIGFVLDIVIQNEEII